MQIKKRLLLDGYMGAYLDVSQAEPRTIAFKTKEPALLNIFKQGADFYKELAIKALLKQKNLNDTIENRNLLQDNEIMTKRQQQKTEFLQFLYGNNDKTEYECINQFVVSNKEYAQNNGYIKTFLGEKITADIDRLDTTSTNLVVQSFTAVILASFFYSAIEKANSLGIDCTPKVFVQDSIILEFPIKFLIHIDLICRKYFREACYKYFEVDYAYKWQVMFNLLSHYNYSFNVDTLELSIDMDSRFKTYFLDHFASNYKFKIVSENNRQVIQDSYKKMLVSGKKNHAICSLDKIHPATITTLKLQLEKLEDIGWYSQQLEPTFIEFTNNIKYFEDSKKKMFK